MATSCQEKLAKLFWGDDLLRGVWLEPLSLLWSVEFVFVLHHVLGLLELLLLTHPIRLLNEWLLLHTARPLLSKLVLLKALLLEILWPLELLLHGTALSEPLLLIATLSLVGVPVSVAAVAVIVACAWGASAADWIIALIVTSSIYFSSASIPTDFRCYKRYEYVCVCELTLKVLFNDLFGGIHAALILVFAFPVLVTSLPSFSVVLVGIPRWLIGTLIFIILFEFPLLKDGGPYRL